jgi:hypothetical protein
MKTLSLFSLLAISTVSLTGVSVASASPQADARVTVAELFTSQSCSSCPPAEALFSKLSEREDLLTIEWHVDYWDDLVHGGSRWKDVYSKKEFTNRQRSYNKSLRGTRAVYTPQAIVNGKLEGVGNRPSEVTNLLQNAEASEIRVRIKANKVNVGASSEDVEVLFVRLLKTHQTDVKGGENKGRKLAGKNIVLSAEVLGKTGSNLTEFNIPSVGEGQTCAVLVQSLSDDVGPILGAAKC